MAPGCLGWHNAPCQSRHSQSRADSHSLIAEPPPLGGHEIKVSAAVGFVIPLNNLFSAKSDAAGLANGGGDSEATGDAFSELGAAAGTGLGGINATNRCVQANAPAACLKDVGVHDGDSISPIPLVEGAIVGSTTLSA